MPSSPSSTPQKQRCRRPGTSLKYPSLPAFSAKSTAPPHDQGNPLLARSHFPVPELCGGFWNFRRVRERERGGGGGEGIPLPVSPSSSPLSPLSSVSFSPPAAFIISSIISVFTTYLPVPILLLPRNFSGPRSSPRFLPSPDLNLPLRPLFSLLNPSDFLSAFPSFSPSFFMKKAKTSPTEAAFPPQPYSAISEHDRARFKLQNLKQDYEDLLKDAELKRRKLTIAKERALKLQGEVRFLRRRYKFLIQNASPTPSKLKPIPQPTSNSLEHRQKTSKTSPILDLNQISFPEGEAEFHFQSEATEMESFRRYLPEGESKSSLADVDVSGGLLKSPICRDAGNSSSRRGKRKVSWQDQVALKV